jgi:hypothetical protein
MQFAIPSIHNDRNNVLYLSLFVLGYFCPSPRKGKN